MTDRYGSSELSCPRKHSSEKYVEPLYYIQLYLVIWKFINLVSRFIL